MPLLVFHVARAFGNAKSLGRIPFETFQEEE